MADLVATVLAKTAQWHRLAGQIEAIRIKHKTRIDAATTTADAKEWAIKAMEYLDAI